MGGSSGRESPWSGSGNGRANSGELHRPLLPLHGAARGSTAGPPRSSSAAQQRPTHPPRQRANRRSAALSLTALLVVLAAAHLLLHSNALSALHRRAVPLTMAELYGGRTAWPLRADDGGDGGGGAGGPSQLLVLGYHYSGTQLLTRLLMLCGVFAGAPHALVADHDGSPYSRWELGGVATLNELLLSRYAAAAAAAAAAAPADPAGHEGGREGSPGRGKDQDEQGGQSGGLVEFHPADRRRRRRQQRQRQQQQRPQPSGAALGFDAEAVAARDAAHYSARVRELLAYLGRRRPWLVHDPRMAWLAPLWLQHMDEPACLLVYRHPQELALAAARGELLRRRRSGIRAVAFVEGGAAGGGGNGASGGGRRGKSASDGGADAAAEAAAVDAAAQLHVARWTNATLSALRACAAVPTVVVPASLLQWRAALPATASLVVRHLEAAGVSGLRRPPPNVLQRYYASFLPASTTSAAAGISGSSAARLPRPLVAGGSGTREASEAKFAALLADADAWLGPPSVAGSGNGNSASGGGGGGGGALPELPPAARALADALEAHLRATFVRPFRHASDYKRLAARLHADYARRAAALARSSAAAAGGGADDAADDGAGLGAAVWAMAQKALSRAAEAGARARGVVGLSAGTSFSGRAKFEAPSLDELAERGGGFGLGGGGGLLEGREAFLPLDEALELGLEAEEAEAEEEEVGAAAMGAKRRRPY